MALAGCQARGEAPAGEAVTPVREAAAVREDEATPVEAGSRMVLVELFSSQGCSSCPAADAVLGRLPALGLGADEVVALTYHVTYWDDLGWRDPFGSARYDERQAEYVAAQVPGHDGEAARGSYTPQMIVDGRVHFPGSDARALVQRVAEARARAQPVTLTACTRANGPAIAVEVQARWRGISARLEVFAALAQREVETAVPRGENAGRRLTEYAVVRDMAGPQRLATEPARLELRTPDGVAAAELEVVVFARSLTTRGIVAVTRAPACAG